MFLIYPDNIQVERNGQKKKTKKVHSTRELLAYVNYNCYGNGPDGLSRTMEMVGWNNQGYQFIRARVYPA